MNAPTITHSDVYAWLEEVKDPEIPVLSLVDLGVITNVIINGDAVTVEMTPTFVGCPAMDFMKTEVLATLRKYGISNPMVEVNFKQPWTSDRITEKGKAALKKFGLAPPPSAEKFISDLSILEHSPCPRCNGINTEMKSPFGPTLCRSLHFCFDCKEAFEQFKPL
jgi:ring-1,2-phenylacetyl-CoA epoxidase subunit PaaD